MYSAINNTMICIFKQCTVHCGIIMSISIEYWKHIYSRSYTIRSWYKHCATDNTLLCDEDLSMLNISLCR